MQKAILAALLALLLCACSAKEEVIKPLPLPKYEKTVALKKLWRKSIGNGRDEQFLLFLPAVTEAAVCAASADGIVACYQKDKGKKIWRRNMGERLASGVAVAYGQLIVSTQSGQVVSLSMNDGSEQWRGTVSSQVLSPALIDAEAVYVQAGDGSLHALNRESGENKWQFQTAIPALSLRGTTTPVFAEGLIVSGFANGKIIAVDKSNGSLVWERRIASAQGASELERLIDVDGKLAFWNDLIFAAAYNGNITAVETEQGRALWEKSFSSYQGVAQGLGLVAGVAEHSEVAAYDMRSGTQLWENALLYGRDLGALSATKDYFVAGDYKGYLHVLYQQDGSIAGRRRLDHDGVLAAAVVDDDRLYVLGNGGKLYALQLKPKGSSKGKQ